MRVNERQLVKGRYNDRDWIMIHVTFDLWIKMNFVIRVCACVVFFDACFFIVVVI